jgi:uncharacterized phiE125 gp8 family phage protein
MTHTRREIKTALVRTVEPTDTPVSLDEVRRDRRIIDRDMDDILLGLIPESVEHAETFLRRQIMTATYRYSLDRFPGQGHVADHGLLAGLDAIEAPRPPLQSVTSLKYIDGDSVQQTLVEGVDYDVDADSEPGRIVPSFGKTWPISRGHVNDVELIFVAGYASAAVVPPTIKRAVRLMVGHLFEHTEAVIDAPAPEELPMGFTSLLNSKRLYSPADEVVFAGGHE